MLYSPAPYFSHNYKNIIRIELVFKILINSTDANSKNQILEEHIPIRGDHCKINLPYSLNKIKIQKSRKKNMDSMIKCINFP